jgi:N-acetylneuraminic acid mutarotase
VHDFDDFDQTKFLFEKHRCRSSSVNKTKTLLQRSKFSFLRLAKSDQSATQMLFLNYVILLSILLTVARANGSWKTIAPLPFARSDHTATTIKGIIYIAGGCNGAQNCDMASGYCMCSSITRNLVAYDPVTNSYTPRGALPPMPRARYRHLACSVDDVIYFFGGRDLLDNLIREVDAFNATSKKWLTNNFASYPLGLGSDNSCSTVGNKIFIFGGYTDYYDQSLNATFSFEPYGNGALQSGGSGLWTKKKGELIVGRGDFASTTRDTFIHVYGGYTVLDFCSPINDAEVYDTVTDTFTRTASMPMKLAEKDDGLFVGGRIVAIGGESKSVQKGCTDLNITALTSVISYHASSDTWRNETPMAEPRMRFASSNVGDVVYSFGGQGLIEDGFDFLPLIYTAVSFSYAISPPAAPLEKVFFTNDIIGAVIGTAAATIVIASAVVLCKRRQLLAAAQRQLGSTVV